ncbi:acyl-CoA dehydrogenase family protein [Hwanghaeella sp.]|uniref:acyl-CoA dehydrogenase family protein n=1 Tax=Hwanghaeella sp. TaxID=2605943 RepID=UPI003CCB94E2
MSVWLTDEQQLIKDSAERLVQNDYTIEARQKLIESEEGFSRDNWATFAELGWLGLPFKEEHGGFGGTAVDMAVLMEALGKGLVVEPFASSVILAGTALDIGGGPLAEALLPEMIAGERLLAFAHSEPKSRFNLSDVTVTADAEGDGFKINGQKMLVYHGGSADSLIVSARTSGTQRDRDGITLFVVDRTAEGVTVRGHRTVDGLRAAEITLTDVKVGADAILGLQDKGFEIVEDVIDRACVQFAAEACGAMEKAVELTVDYTKERKQFGRPLSSFQALQHKMADMYSAHQFARALTYRAAALLDDCDPAERAEAAAAVKVKCGNSSKLVGEEAIQLHGGMGMTADMPIGHYFKRLTMINALFGNAQYHLKRYAAMKAE